MAQLSYPCLYTSQKLKKKKSWNDGKVIISVKNSSCKLFAAADSAKIMASTNNCGGNSLDSIALTESQLKSITAGSCGGDVEIEFEKYLVTIEVTGPVVGQTSNAGTIPAAANKTNNMPSTQAIAPSNALIDLVKKNPFKIPKYVPPPAVTATSGNQPMHQMPNISRPPDNQYCGTKRGHYRIEGDDLDDLWEEKSPVTVSKNGIQEMKGEQVRMECYQPAAIQLFKPQHPAGSTVLPCNTEQRGPSTKFTIDLEPDSENEDENDSSLENDDYLNRHFDARDHQALKQMRHTIESEQSSAEKNSVGADDCCEDRQHQSAGATGQSDIWDLFS
jgi:hypothetical protein